MTAKQQSTESGGGLRTVTLTADQWNTLYFYLLTSTKYRNGEIEAWERLALETNEDGSPKVHPRRRQCALSPGSGKDAARNRTKHLLTTRPAGENRRIDFIL